MHLWPLGFAVRVDGESDNESLEKRWEKDMRVVVSYLIFNHKIETNRLCDWGWSSLTIRFDWRIAEIISALALRYDMISLSKSLCNLKKVLCATQAKLFWQEIKRRALGDSVT